MIFEFFLLLFLKDQFAWGCMSSTDHVVGRFDSSFSSDDVELLSRENTL